MVSNFKYHDKFCNSDCNISFTITKKCIYISVEYQDEEKILDELYEKKNDIRTITHDLDSTYHRKVGKVIEKKV